MIVCHCHTQSQYGFELVMNHFRSLTVSVSVGRLSVVRPAQLPKIV